MDFFTGSGPWDFVLLGLVLCVRTKLLYEKDRIDHSALSYLSYNW